MNALKYILSTISLATMAAGVISCVRAHAAEENQNGVFKYREIYLPEGTGESAEELGLNTVDNDWGIWGHNLAIVLPDDPSESIYAKRKDGSKAKSQFCFSSERLYEYIEDYIDKKYDDDEHIRFAIIPNDNDIVCVDAECVKAGNTVHDASPAIFNLINRLAKRFPNHLFFTSHYRTTKSLPTDTMPGNTGVLISAINYPLSPTPTAQEQEFLHLLRSWDQKTDNILVWDYINNFDDYFTPYPIFEVMQHRLQNYAENGVTAIFMNGSGTDYSSFSDLKAGVLSDLTINPDTDWRESLRKHAMKHYPVSGETIVDFIIAQEEYLSSVGKPLPLYEGVEAASKLYLPKDEFIAFHDKLLQLRKDATGKERENLDRVAGALALTRLELNRIDGNLQNTEELLADLKGLQKFDIPYYNEASWSVDHYVRDYNRLLKYYNENNGKNKLKGKRLEALTPLDPEYSDITILTDGMLGLPSNYHSGNLITSPDQATRIAIPNTGDYKHLQVGLVYNPAYRISLPAEVELRVGGKIIKSITPDYPADNSGHLFLDFDLPGGNQGTAVLTVYKDPDTHSMAIDEIEAW